MSQSRSAQSQMFRRAHPGAAGATARLLAHADWSLDPRKRWVCVAERYGARWHIRAPRLADDIAPPDKLLAALSRRASSSADDGPVLLGIDAVLGLPRAWGNRAGVTHFLSFLTEATCSERWSQFWSPALTPAEINLERPFFPARPGGARQVQLVEALGLSGRAELRRRCDMPRAGAPTPCPLFWTLGANQVGKASLCAWRDMLIPALLDPALDVRVWPFDGQLEETLRGHVAVAEVYPAEVGSWLQLDLRGAGGKRNQAARAQQAARLRAAMDALAVEVDAALAMTIEDGFGEKATGEDAFDAFVGVVGLLMIALGARQAWQPRAPEIIALEGWVLGRDGAGLEDSG